MKFSLSIGIMAYNEEGNIGRLLQTVLEEKPKNAVINEIIVISSGSTDKTNDKVREFEKIDSRIRLIVQEKREGKASAINLFLAEAAGDVLILESADTAPATNTVYKLVQPFIDPRVGMTGGRPVPRNRKDTFIGYTVHMMWSLHHKIALVTPKLGEMVAFRNIVEQIPLDTAVDEASIEAKVRKAGYELRYVSDAVVWNKGPENVKDFLTQRRRIAAGHLHLMKQDGYEVSTFDTKNIMRMLLREKYTGLKELIWTFGAIFLEGLGRGLGYYDFSVRKKNPFIWDIASSTKKWD